jgi:hypothetical protein
VVFWAAGTPLPERFADQFAPWDFGGVDVTSGGCSGTLLRLALRTPAQAAAGGVSKVTALACYLLDRKLFLGRATLVCPWALTLPNAMWLSQNPGSQLQLQESWDEDAAAKLLGDFVAAVTPSLLFQRHLRRVRVMCFEANASEPYLLAQVSRACNTPEIHVQMREACSWCRAVQHIAQLKQAALDRFAVMIRGVLCRCTGCCVHAWPRAEACF